MDMKRKLIFFCCVLWCLANTQAAAIFKNQTVWNSSRFVFSSVRASANEAVQHCSSINGRLAEFSQEEVRKFVRPKLIEEYISEDLALIKIYQNPENKFYLKFRTEGFQDWQNITGWREGSSGKLISFYMYKRNVSSFTIEWRFGYAEDRSLNDRDLITTNICCGWLLNFHVFAGAPENDNTIALFNYRSSNPSFSSNVFLANEPHPSDIANPEKNSKNILIPDISVFTGARSHEGETDWVWENGTMVNDSNYPTSNSSVCQQMSLPLTYDDRINLLPKRCDDGKAYFVCEIVPFTISLSPILCTTDLQVMWNLTSLDSFNSSVVGDVQIVLEDTNLSVNVSFRQLSYTLSNLTEDTDYTVKTAEKAIRFKVRNSRSLQATARILQPYPTESTSSANARTGRQPPRPVEVAFVNSSSTSTCTLSWVYSWSSDDLQYQPTIYEIQIQDQQRMIDSVSVDLPDEDQQLSETERTLQYGVDLSLYPLNITLNFKSKLNSVSRSTAMVMWSSILQNVKNETENFYCCLRAGCQCGFSTFTTVNGTCSTPKHPPVTFQEISSYAEATLVLFSSSRATATTAKRICSSRNGSIATFNAKEIKQASLLLNDTYLKGLELVEIVENPVTTTSLKYRSMGKNLSSQSKDWEPPTGRRVRSLRLYKIPHGVFTKQLRFCARPKRDVIGEECEKLEILEKNPFEFSYNLFAGSKNRSYTIKLHHYFPIVKYPSSNLFLREPVNESIFYRVGSPNPIYIPDISIFTGARSDVNQTNWFWENGAMVNDSNYPPPDPSVCQQMSLPLTYDDGINLLPKHCEDDVAYFACEVPLNFTFDKISCNSSALQLSWKAASLKEENATIQVLIQETNQLFSAPFQQSPLILNNLSPNSFFTFNITVFVLQPYLMNITSTKSERTLRSPAPLPVQSANITSSPTSTCIVEWQHEWSSNFSSQKPISYQIHIRSVDGVYHHNVSINVSDAEKNIKETSNVLQYVVDFSLYPPNSSISFTIQAGSECGYSEAVTVNGTCNIPFEPKTFKQILSVSEKSLVLISSKKANEKTAESTCKNVDGKTATLRQHLTLPTLLNAYARNTVKVYIHQRTDENYSFIFQKTNFFDTMDVPMFKTPEVGLLRSIRLYEKPFGAFTKRIKFCRTNGTKRDSIRVKCKGEWSSTFDLFGGFQGSGVIEIYNHIPSKDFPQSSNLYLRQNSSFKNQNPTPLYIPDISIFTGARSDVNQTNWFWENGTMVNDSNYPTSDPSVCQQMSLPLTYDDGINLLPKRCKDDEAYFACEVPLSFDVVDEKCNSDSLRVSWNAKDLEENVTVKIFVKESNQTYAVPFSDTSHIIDNLPTGRNYSVQISLDCNICDGSNVTWNLIGKPEKDVVNPTVVTNCTVQWSRSAFNQEPTKYTIKAKSDNSESTTTADATNIKKIETNLFQCEVDLSSFGEGEEVFISIQAHYEDCNSEVFAADATCSAPVSIQPTSGQISGGVVGAVVGIIVLCLLIGLIILYRKRRDRKTSSNGSRAERNAIEARSDVPRSTGAPQPVIEERTTEEPSVGIYENMNPQPRNSIINAVDLKAFYTSQCMEGFPYLEKQFKKILQKSKSNEKEHSIASNPQNKGLNRYKNIYPYDHAIVKLSGDKYINAGHIAGYKKSKNYIATQGPKAQTVENFWEMVWQQNSSIIVMLCQCVEKGKSKCEKYWPDLSDVIVKSCFRIKGEEVEQFGGIIKRTFTIENATTGQQRRITQFHYISWPDHDVPTTTSSMVNLRSLVNQEHQNKTLEGPIIVHCSAGAGRTGAYIAIDYLTQQLQEEAKVDVMKLILKMRESRKDMVQNANQYVFVHKVLVENHVLARTDFNFSEFLRFCEENLRTELLTNEFNLLSDMVITTPSVIPAKESPDSVYVNQAAVSPHDVSIYRKETNELIKMNASFITCDYYPGTFIASVGPQENNEESFWEMVLINNSRVVVAMESLSSDSFTQTQHYNNEVFDLGNVVIAVHQISELKTLLIHQLIVSLRSDPSTFVEITHILVKNFNNQSTRELSSTLADIAGKMKTAMETAQTTHTKSTAVVYCRDGLNKTGLLLAVAMMVERIKFERKVDVFRTVKDLRDYRSGIINDFNEYKNCYSIIGEHLASNFV